MMENIFSDELVDAPDDIERVIEGGEDDIQNGSGRESGNEETKNEDDAKDKDKVKVKRKLGPRPTLNAERLKGPRGIGIMESFFSDIKLRGKGHEKEDLDIVMGRLEHWAHRLFPRMQFDDALDKIEKLGYKKPVSNYVKRMRLGLEDDESSGTGVIDEPPESPPPVDAFDQLINSSVVPPQPTVNEMTEEQRERMLQNRLIAEERRRERLQRAKELKEKFLANQAQNQMSNSQTLDTEQNGANQTNEAEVNNQHVSAMEIDENVITENNPECAEELVNNLKNDENGDILQTERNDYQSHSVQRDDNLEIDLQGIEIEGNEDIRDIPMEGVDNYPDILTQRNEAQSVVTQTNAIGPDVVQRNDIQSDNFRESDQNRPDFLSNQTHLPDILVGRDEMNWNEKEAGEPLERVNNQSNSFQENDNSQL